MPYYAETGHSQPPPPPTLQDITDNSLMACENH
jgi:hypothetical protein